MMPTLHLVALGLYGLAAALALAPFAGLPSLSRRWSVALPGAGALAHGVALAQLNPAGLAPILSLLALFLIVLQLCCELLLRATAVALFTAPLAAGPVGAARLPRRRAAGAARGGVARGGAGVGGSAGGVREHRRLRGGRPGLLGAEGRRAGKGTLPLNTMGA